MIHIALWIASLLFLIVVGIYALSIGGAIMVWALLGVGKIFTAISRLLRPSIVPHEPSTLPGPNKIHVALIFAALFGFIIILSYFGR